MPQKVPKTKADELFKELNLFTLITPPSEFQIQGFFREAEKVKKVNASQGFMLIGLIHYLNNDYQKTKSAFINALANVPEDRETVILNYSVALMGLGKVTEGYDVLLNNYIQGSYQLTIEICRVGILLGLFEQTSVFIEKLESFPNNSDDLLFFKGAIDTFKKSKITEKETNEVSKLLISVYSPFKITPSSSSILIDHEDGSLITALYFKDINSETLTELSTALIEKLTESELPAVEENKLSPVFLKAN